MGSNEPLCIDFVLTRQHLSTLFGAVVNMPPHSREVLADLAPQCADDDGRYRLAPICCDPLDLFDQVQWDAPASLRGLGLVWHPRDARGRCGHTHLEDVGLVHSDHLRKATTYVSAVTRMFERMGAGVGARRDEMTVREVETLAQWAGADPWLLLRALTRAAQQDLEINVESIGQCRKLVDREVALEVQVPSQRSASDSAPSRQLA